MEQHGWTETLGGKHVVKMVKQGVGHPVTLPMHKGADYSVGLTNEILKEAGLRGSDSGEGSGA